MSIFEKASRKGLRFSTVRGHLTTEQMWNVPLASKDDFNLDTIATALVGEINQASGTSVFGTTDKSKAAKKELDELRLDIIKHIHGVLSKEEEAKKKRVDARRERQELAELLAKRQSEKKEALTEEEIRKRLAEIDGDDSEG